MIDKSLYLSTGFPIDRQTITGIKDPAAVHFASGRCLPVLEEVIQMGNPMIGLGMGEDLDRLQENVKQGNLKNANKLSLSAADRDRDIETK